MQMPMDLKTVLACALVLVLALAGSAEGQPEESVSGEPSEQGLVAAGLKKHRKPQKPPIDLGASGGNAEDLGVGPVGCVSNTLGGLVQGDARYILSTNGTLARRNGAKKGEPIIQPGLRDTKHGACNTANPKGHVVADLTKFKKLKFGGPNNVVDAALAEVRPGMVDPTGDIIGVGTPGSRVVEPFVGQKVQKSGRGTGARTGTVTALNVSVNVDYLGRTVRFINQFVVESDTNQDLYVSGDSGAVFFENKSTCPGWVGLSVAGSIPNARFAFASPISTVFKQLQKVKPKGPLEPVGCVGGGSGQQDVSSSRLRREVLDAKRIQRQIERDVLQIPGVAGMGVGLAKDNPDEVVFKILVEDESEAVRAYLPQRLGKLRYEVMSTGRVSVG